jgi:hypothetical protein
LTFFLLSAIDTRLAIFENFQMKLTGFPLLRWAILMVVGLVSLAVLFYTAECWCGKRAWENYKREIAAKGESLEWKDHIPPPVPDEQNFFMAPKMQEWFVKSGGKGVTNEFVEHLTRTNTTSLVIAEVVVTQLVEKPAATESNILMVRFDRNGKSIFLPSEVIATGPPPTYVRCLKISFTDAPMTTVVEHLSRMADLHCVFDPSAEKDWRDGSGRLFREPMLSFTWENITPHDALLAVLDNYGLRMVEGPGTNAAVIIRKSPTDASISASTDTREKIEQALRDAVGENAIASQGFAILKRPLADIRPVRLVLQTEGKLDEKKIIELFTQYFPNRAAKPGSPIIHVEPRGGNSYRVLLDAENAADYLAWSGQFKPEFVMVFDALKRPYARMDGDYSNVYAMPIPNYAAVRVFVQTLAQRAQCHLLLGQADQALAELTLLNDSRRILEFRPSGKTMTMVSAMINVAVVGLITETIADCFRLHAWREPQLHALQAQLEQINLTPFLFDALKGDPVGICHSLEIYCMGGDAGPLNPSSAHSHTPKGLIYQNMINIVRLERMYLDGFDLTNNAVFPNIWDKAADDIYKSGK